MSAADSGPAATTEQAAAATSTVLPSGPASGSGAAAAGGSGSESSGNVVGVTDVASRPKKKRRRVTTGGDSADEDGDDGDAAAAPAEAAASTATAPAAAAAATGPAATTTTAAAVAAAAAPAAGDDDDEDADPFKDLLIGDTSDEEDRLELDSATDASDVEDIPRRERYELPPEPVAGAVREKVRRCVRVKDPITHDREKDDPVTHRKLMYRALKQLENKTDAMNHPRDYLSLTRFVIGHRRFGMLVDKVRELDAAKQKKYDAMSAAQKKKNPHLNVKRKGIIKAVMYDCRERMRSRPFLEALARHNVRCEDADEQDVPRYGAMWGDKTTTQAIQALMATLRHLDDAGKRQFANRHRRGDYEDNTWLSSKPVVGAGVGRVAAAEAVQGSGSDTVHQTATGAFKQRPGAKKKQSDDEEEVVGDADGDDDDDDDGRRSRARSGRRTGRRRAAAAAAAAAAKPGVADDEEDEANSSDLIDNDDDRAEMDERIAAKIHSEHPEHAEDVLFYMTYDGLETALKTRTHCARKDCGAALLSRDGAYVCGMCDFAICRKCYDAEFEVHIKSVVDALKKKAKARKAAQKKAAAGRARVLPPQRRRRAAAATADRNRRSSAAAAAAAAAAATSDDDDDDGDAAADPAADAAAAAAAAEAAARKAAENQPAPHVHKFRETMMRFPPPGTSMLRGYSCPKCKKRVPRGKYFTCYAKFCEEIRCADCDVPPPIRSAASIAEAEEAAARQGARVLGWLGRGSAQGASASRKRPRDN